MVRVVSKSLVVQAATTDADFYVIRKSRCQLTQPDDPVQLQSGCYGFDVEVYYLDKMLRWGWITVDSL
jgi:hypothetical protein